MSANKDGRTTSPSMVGGIPTPALFNFRPISLKAKRNPDKVDTVERYHHRAFMQSLGSVVSLAVCKTVRRKALVVQFHPAAL